MAGTDIRLTSFYPAYPQPSEHGLAATGRVLRRKRLGGMLNFYYRAAA